MIRHLQEIVTAVIVILMLINILPVYAAETLVPSDIRFIPAVMASIDPELYTQAKDHLLDMNYADYFYITSYPEYGSYRTEHDPSITAYCNLITDVPQPGEPSTLDGIGSIIVIALGLALIVALIVLIKRKK